MGRLGRRCAPRASPLPAACAAPQGGHRAAAAAGRAVRGALGGELCYAPGAACRARICLAPLTAAPCGAPPPRRGTAALPVVDTPTSLASTGHSTAQGYTKNYQAKLSRGQAAWHWTALEPPLARRCAPPPPPLCRPLQPPTALDTLPCCSASTTPHCGTSPMSSGWEPTRHAALLAVACARPAAGRHSRMHACRAAARRSGSHAAALAPRCPHLCRPSQLSRRRWRACGWGACGASRCWASCRSSATRGTAPSASLRPSSEFVCSSTCACVFSGWLASACSPRALPQPPRPLSAAPQVPLRPAARRV